MNFKSYQHTYLCRLSLLFLLNIFAVCVAVAQPGSPGPLAAPTPVDVAIESASARLIGPNTGVKGWAVTLSFTQEFDTALNSTDSDQARRAGNYQIINTSTNAVVPVNSAGFAPVTGTTGVTFVKLILLGEDALNKDDKFYIFARNLLFKNAKPKSLPIQEILVAKEATENGGEKISAEKVSGELKPAWGLAPSKGRDDSQLYGAYEVTKARGLPTTGTGDLKVKIPFAKTFWNRTSSFSPLVDIKVSSDAGADPDSFKFALEWFLPLHVGQDPNATFPYTAVDLINSGKIEAPKNFNNINALWESRWLFPSSHFPWNSRKFRMFLDPFVGSELGKNLKSPLKTIEGHGLARLMVGADLTIQIPVRNLKALKGFEFTSEYVRRWPLKRELLVDKDANGNLVSLALSKSPKDYSDSKFIIKVNNYFGPYVGYEWGRLPPNYELVDHKWTIGLLFKAKVKAE